MKIAVFCIFRDSEETLPRLFSQFQSLEGSTHEFTYYFFENDSRDNTPKLLNEFLLTRKGRLQSVALGAKKFSSTNDVERMIALCLYRNSCKSLSRGQTDFDVALIVDSDIVFDGQSLERALQSLSSCPNAAMITANVRQNYPDFVCGENDTTSYYDMSPLRDRYGNSGLYFADCPFAISEDRHRWAKGLPVRVMSAFGGFAVVSWQAFCGSNWSTIGFCDHVNFCHDVSSFGTIWIDPLCKVSVSIDLSVVTDDVKVKARDLIPRAKNINNLFEVSKGFVAKT